MLTSTNSDIKFILSSTIQASLNYRQGWVNGINVVNPELNNAVYFDLAANTIYLNGHAMGTSFVIEQDENGKTTGFTFTVNGKEYTIDEANIGKWTVDAKVIPAANVQGGLMSKEDKVAFEYMKYQLGISAEEENNNIVIKQGEMHIPTAETTIEWVDWQN